MENGTDWKINWPMALAVSKREKWFISHRCRPKRTQDTSEKLAKNEPRGKWNALVFRLYLENALIQNEDRYIHKSVSKWQMTSARLLSSPFYFYRSKRGKRNIEKSMCFVFRIWNRGKWNGLKNKLIENALIYSGDRYIPKSVLEQRMT